MDNKTSLLRNSNLVSTTTNPYIHAATSDNTRRAYQADIRHFENWGGRLPAQTEIVLAYLQAFADKLNPRTLSRRLTALKNWHSYQGFPDPTAHPAISKTMTGIMRTHGKPKDKAPPLLPEQLLAMVNYLKQENSLSALRDDALLQLAFFGAFRRSEVVAIQVEHIEWKPQGIDILIPHSKTDQTREGQYCAIPYGQGELCAIKALKTWLDEANINEGFIFRRMQFASVSPSHNTKNINTNNSDNTLVDQPITPLSVNNILKKRAKQVGIPNADQLSSHSLRRGLASAASQKGASLPAIMRQGRWKNMNTVLEYIEATARFEENAAQHILAEQLT